MSTLLKIILIPVILVYVFLIYKWPYYFYISRPNYIKNIKESSNDIIVLFQQHKDLRSLNKNTNTLWMSPDIKNVQKKIPKGVQFYYCNTLWIIREEENGSTFWYKEFKYSIYPLSHLDTLSNNILYEQNKDGWLYYDQNLDLWDYRPCYPWDDLEDYNKRYSSITRYLPHNP